MFSENTLLFILFLRPALDVDQRRVHHDYAGVCLERVLSVARQDRHVATTTETRPCKSLQHDASRSLK